MNHSNLNFHDDLDNKVKEFTQAIQKYLNYGVYKRLEKIVSFLIVVLQIITLFNTIILYKHISFFCFISTLFLAYLATDFINGLVHMYMDNNTSYISVVGPYVAAFHLHHAKYFYQIRHPLKVYFDESGTKFWLLFYLIFLAGVQVIFQLNIYFNIGLVAFGIFSSIAELSHYWCHQANEKNKLILWLQNNHILLSKKHHKAHHCSDNTQYAFLNGSTDFIINFIARCCYKGYKNHADKHTKIYLQQKF